MSDVTLSSITPVPRREQTFSVCKVASRVGRLIFNSKLSTRNTNLLKCNNLEAQH